MPSLVLKGNKDNYSFSTDNPSLILKKNGKFGSVYIGKKESDGTKVIIKHLHPSLKTSVDAVERFRKEATIQVEHPSIISTIDVITQWSEYYIVRKYVEGEDIGTYLKKQRLKPTELLLQVVPLAIQTLNALDVLHQHGIIHRDIRPGNILIEVNTKGEPEIRIIDFGLAKIQGLKDALRVPFSLIYSPPEQLLNHNECVTPASDLYALAVTIHELLTGNWPFYHRNPEALMNMMLSFDLPDNKAIPPFLLSVLRKASFKQKLPLPPNRYSSFELQKFLLLGLNGRYANAGQMKTDLIKCQVLIETHLKTVKKGWKFWLNKIIRPFG